MSGPGREGAPEVPQGADTVPQGVVTDAPPVAAAAASTVAPPAGGVLSSNTPPPNSNGVTVAGGEDWLEWSMYVNWGESWKSVRERLKAAKAAAEDQRACRGSGADLVRIGIDQGVVSPCGVRRGRKGKGQYLAFSMTVDGMVLQIADRPVWNGNSPNVSCRADGMACLVLGGRTAWERGRALVETMGGRIEKEKLSRVDMALDLAGVCMGAFVSAHREGRYITRATAKGMHEGSGVTLYLGKSPLLVRIYDKLAEVKTKGDSLKHGILKLLRWGGDAAEAVRVEYELRREALKDRGIDSPEDYFAKRADLAAYLCGEWCRFTVNEVDRTNTTRAEVLPIWKTVAAGFEAWTGAPQGLELEPLPSGVADVGQLHRQAVGVLLTAAVLCNIAPTPEAFLKHVTAVIRHVADGLNVPVEMKRRYALLPA